MNCCQHECYSAQFNEQHAANDVRRYRKKGPDPTTRMLLGALAAEGVDGASVLDVGAGIGVVHHELLGSGARTATHIDASMPHILAAREETARRGNAARVTFLHGDVVALASDLPAADVVTLDRVICCYADMERLVAATAHKARRLYGAVYPRERWVIKAFLALGNAMRRLRGNAFRTYVHPPAAIDAALRREGLTPRTVKDTFVWRVAVYAR